MEIIENRIKSCVKYVPKNPQPETSKTEVYKAPSDDGFFFGLIGAILALVAVCSLFFGLDTTATVESGLSVPTFFFVVFGLMVHFIPTFIAVKRKHKNQLAILMMNILLGWTLILWFVAIIWACTDNVKTDE